ncbi:hypothetical protein EV360DRAFT_79455 [Lentinula raphanica]|nr:hypothetical protein EV360DRAFT_79455 [Lentinula raphanica]
MAELRDSFDIDIQAVEGSLKDALTRQPGGMYLKHLEELRRAGWGDADLDDHYKKQRRIADSPNSQTEMAWFRRMKGIFQELDEQASIVPASERFTFLDLGFCPGGFASYILSRNTAAFGTGISLPIKQSGHRILLEQHLCQRFEPHYDDLGYYNLLNVNEEYTLFLHNIRLRDLPRTICNSLYDLVILDGNYLRTYVDPNLEAPDSEQQWGAHRLIISQIIISLQTIAPGGSIVMRLRRPESLITATILYMLDEISSDLKLVKPRTMHATRGTFYAVAKGVGSNDQSRKKKDEYLFQFRLLWYQISFGGNDGQGRYLNGKDIEFIASCDQLLRGYAERLGKLSTHVWRIQAESLNSQFRHKGIIA